VISRSPVRAVFLFFACLYLLSIGRGFYSSDGEVMFKTTGALVEHGTFALAPDPGLPQIVRGRGGQYFSKYDPGLPLIGVPFYVTGDWIGQINHAHRAQLAATFYLLIPALAAAGALAALAVIARRYSVGGNALTTGDTENTERSSSVSLYPPVPLSPSEMEQGGAKPPSESQCRHQDSVPLELLSGSREPDRRCSLAWLWVVLAAGLATPLWVYGRELFAEAVLACALTVAVMAVSFAPSTRMEERATGEITPDRGFLWLLAGGAAFGIGVLTRAALAIYAPALALLIVRRAGTRQPRAIALRLGIFAAGALPFALIVLWHNALRFGSPFEFGYAGEGFTTPPWKGISGLLVSPGKGVALYAPPLILSAIVWRRFRRADRGLADFLALAWGAALIVYGAWWAWDSGWCWGPRLLVPLMPLSCLPLTALPDGHRWRVALAVLVAAGIAVQVPGVLTTVVPHYAELAGNGTSGLDRIDFVPRDSPLVDAARRLLHGQMEPLAMFHLRGTGLPPTWTVGVPLLLIAGAITGAYSLLRRRNP
jgi:hypothetical protein